MKAIFLALALTAAVVSRSAFGEIPHSPAPPAGLFGSDHIATVKIEVVAEDLAKLQVRPRQYVSSRVRVEGRSFSHAEVRLKGHGSFQPVESKPNLMVRLNQGATANTEFPHDRLVLNNSTQDPSFIRWKLASELFLKAGQAAPRVNFAVVQFNGRDLGLYVLVEPTDKVFLTQSFGSSSGNLYEGIHQDVESQLEWKSDGSSDGQLDLQSLARACQEANLKERWTRLRAILDVERFASFMAMEILVAHDDGYSLNRNNFRLYHDPITDRMVFVPHGLDLIFRNFRLALEPRWGGTVARAYMETTEGKQLYRTRLAQLGEMVYSTDELRNRAHTLSRFLADHLPNHQKDVRQLERAAVGLDKALQWRAGYVLSQIRERSSN